MCVCVCVCVYACVSTQIWFPVDGDAWGSHMEASLNGGDWVTNAAYFSVVSLCAPIWEEVRDRHTQRKDPAVHFRPAAASVCFRASCATAL